MPYAQFVTKADFNVEPYVLNIKDEEADFNAFILRKQDEMLQKLFGIRLYAAMVEGLTPEEVDIAERWKDLRDGDVYDVYEYSFRWKGMKDMFIPYIYAEWLSAKSFSVVGIGGTAQATSENSTAVNSAHKIAAASNEFVRKAQDGTDTNSILYDNSLFSYLYFSEGRFAEAVAPDTIQQYMWKYWNRLKAKNAFGI